MEESRRALELEDRLAEVEHALNRISARGGSAARYLRREIEDLLEECRTQRDRWAEIARRAELTLSVLDETRERQEGRPEA